MYTTLSEVAIRGYLIQKREVRGSNSAWRLVAIRTNIIHGYPLTLEVNAEINTTATFFHIVPNTTQNLMLIMPLRKRQ
jgi:hypothetical protein